MEIEDYSGDDWELVRVFHTESEADAWVDEMEDIHSGIGYRVAYIPVIDHGAIRNMAYGVYSYPKD